MDENHRGKIKKAPAPEVVKYLINPAIKTDLIKPSSISTKLMS